MKKQISILIALLSLNSISAKLPDRAEFPSPYSTYSIGFYAKQMSCRVTVNNFYMYSNLGDTKGIAFTGFSIDNFIENGKNTIILEFGPSSPSDKGEETTEENLERFCRILIKKQTRKDKHKEENEHTISELFVKLDENNQVVIDDQTYLYNTPESPKNSIILKSLPLEDQNPNTNYMSIISRKLNINDTANWAWGKATKYDEVPKNRQLLEEAYSEMWQVFNTKNLKKFDELIKLSQYESILSFALDSDKSQVFLENGEDFFYRKMDLKTITKMHPFDPSKFKVKQFLNGKVVLLQYFEHDAVFGHSPIIYEVDGHKKFYTFYFAFINGKFRVVR